MKHLKLLIKIICVLLAVVLAAYAVFNRPNGTVGFPFSSELHTEDAAALSAGGTFEKIASSGFIELYFDTQTTAFAVKETSQNKMWYSAPTGTNTANIVLNVQDAAGLHTLSSIAGVRRGQAESVRNADGISVTYVLSSTEKEQYTTADLAFEATLNLALRDGSLFASAEIKNLSGNPDCAVVSCRMLPYFGAFKSPSAGDFLLLPDGCGAIACPYYETEEKQYVCRVYGSDLAFSPEKSVSRALFGAFGVKNGESAFAAIINEGDAYASVRAISSKDRYSSVCAEFAYDGVYHKNKTAFIFTDTEKKLEICYKFLSAENASYSAIAASCREQLIRSNALPVASIKNSESVPLFLTLTGYYNSGAWSLGSEKLTTFAQTLDILKRLKSKGVDNICVRYKNVFGNDSASVASALGSKKALTELTDYTSSMNISLYFDVNLLTFSSHFGDYSLYAAKRPDKSTYCIHQTQSTDALPTIASKSRFRTMNGTSRFVSKLIDHASDYNITGLCVNDAGSQLHSDISHTATNRGSAKETVASQLPAIANLGSICVDTGNLYTVKNAAAIVGLPMQTHYETGEAYRQIPFAQMVYHGSTILAGGAINSAENTREAVLRCIEYGVCPAYSAIYANDGVNHNAVFKNISDDLLNGYESAADALFGLEGERITDHNCLEDGVYCTEFSNGTMIYTNYGTKSVKVNGVTVGGMNYLKID